MVIQPNAFATELNRMISANTGQRYWIMTRKNFLSAEAALAMDDFFLDFCHTDDSRNEKTGGNGSNWHHYGVCQEVEEIQELHAKNGERRKTVR